ncbi:hypothetical protein C8J57DRAFT_1235260 [Mycena rebaudengoi]|nr:hypothetical protein C8J57DRAFT_1235260 [Mycena rebaudengoi]
MPKSNPSSCPELTNSNGSGERGVILTQVGAADGDGEDDETKIMSRSESGPRETIVMPRSRKAFTSCVGNPSMDSTWAQSGGQASRRVTNAASRQEWRWRRVVVVKWWKKKIAQPSSSVGVNRPRNTSYTERHTRILFQFQRLTKTAVFVTARNRRGAKNLRLSLTGWISAQYKNYIDSEVCGVANLLTCSRGGKFQVYDGENRQMRGGICARRNISNKRGVQKTWEPTSSSSLSFPLLNSMGGICRGKLSDKHMHPFIVLVIGLGNLNRAVDVDFRNLELGPSLNIWNPDKSRAEEREKKSITHRTAAALVASLSVPAEAIAWEAGWGLENGGSNLGKEAKEN